MENKFTEEEFTKLKSMMSEITTHLPEHYVNQIWSAHVKIKGQPEPQPCTCSSSGGLWAGAVSTIRNYIKDIETNAV
jgi:hypothetical protein